MDISDNDSYRVDITVGFNAICIQSGVFLKRTFFIGSTGAEIQLILTNGN
jgi:hypothetical protein